MKKFIGYGAFYLVGLIFIFCMMFRVESLDSKTAINGKNDNIEIAYNLK